MRVMIAGVAASSGRLLAERLLAAPGVEAVIGLDAGRCMPPIMGLRFVRAALTQPEWLPLLAEVDAFVLLTGVRWPGPRAQHEAGLVAGGKAAVQAALAAGVPKIVVAHSAALYGAQPPGLLAESAQVCGHSADAYARARAQLSDYLAEAARRASPAVITELRTAWVCGPRHAAPIQHVAAGPVLVCGAEERAFQVVHEDDLIDALTLALRGDLPGAYNLAPDAGVSFRELAGLLGESRACSLLGWAVLRAWWGWRWRGRPTPPGWLRALYCAGTLDGARLRAAGWQPRYTGRETLIEGLAAHRGG